MKECWICRRTEEQFERDFLENILDDEYISDKTKEAAKSGKCSVDDKDGIEDVVALTYEGSDGYDDLYLYCCPICSGLLNMRMKNAIYDIEDQHSDLFEWYKNFRNWQLRHGKQEK